MDVTLPLVKSTQHTSSFYVCAIFAVTTISCLDQRLGATLRFACVLWQCAVCAHRALPAPRRFPVKALGRIPNGRGVSTFLNNLRRGCTQPLIEIRIIGGPAKRRNFDDSNIIKSRLVALETWVNPNSGEGMLADGI